MPLRRYDISGWTIPSDVSDFGFENTRRDETGGDRKGSSSDFGLIYFVS